MLEACGSLIWHATRPCAVAPPAAPASEHRRQGLLLPDRPDVLAITDAAERVPQGTAVDGMHPIWFHRVAAKAADCLYRLPLLSNVREPPNVSHR